jgi:hypothetical protein
MLPCSVALAQSSQLESDLTLKYIVQYQQMLENVLEVHQNARKSPSCLDAQTKPMIHDLDTWRLSLPQHLRSMGERTSLKDEEIMTDFLKACSQHGTIT